MELKDILKKYWFLLIVTLGLLVYVVIYCMQAYSNRTIYVNAKQEDGKSIVYTLNNENYYADELYEELYSSLGEQATLVKWSKDVINSAVETSEEVSTMANNYYSYIISANEKANIDTSLKNSGYVNGYDDLEEYCIDIVKSQTFYNDFYRENFDTYVPRLLDTLKPRKVYHILVKVADIGSATAEDGSTVRSVKLTSEEQEKYDAVVAALANGEDFKEVAKKYSDDGSANDGGYLGIYTTSSAESTFVSEFAEALNKAETGQVTQPVLSQYGYHWIYTEEPSNDELKESDEFLSEVGNNYNYASIVAIKNKSDELGFKIISNELNDSINNYLELAANELNESEESE